MKNKAIMVCEECSARNYRYEKSKSNDKRLELNKFCPHCNKVTKHKETK
ncbi:MAG: 50S ribosomal protein L33 [Mycoplasmataceae bacterium]|nr:50S ribosomal protein L33 [Mycoplasmataceae bacterium]